VGVEINKTDTMNIVGHHNAMREIQFLSVEPVSPKFEITQITVDNPNNGGSYYLAF